MRLIDADKLKAHYAWWNDESKEVFDQIIDAQPIIAELDFCKTCAYYSENGVDWEQRPACWAWFAYGVDKTKDFCTRYVKAEDEQ